MKTQTDKTQEPQHSITPRVVSESSNGGTAQLKDNRTSSLSQRKLRSGMDSMDNSNNPIQRKNKTGLPDNLKSGIENLSGYSMDDVKVHYNSSKPAQLQAHAYAQGTDIHLAPGQEKHLPHEAWHVVQQKQGRVQPTRQLKSKVNINDDAGLEKEADIMGNKALRTVSFGLQGQTVDEYNTHSNVAQLKKKSENAKVGIEIETTLPVRKNNEVTEANYVWSKIIKIISERNYPVEEREVIRRVIKPKYEDELWNLISTYRINKSLDTNQEKRLSKFATKASKKLSEKFDPGYKKVVHKGNGWEAMVDHVHKVRNAAGGGKLMTDSAVEIVTKPVSKRKDAKNIITNIQSWLGTVITAIGRENSYVEDDYRYEIPESLRNTLLPNGQLLGNIQVNVGMNLEDVQSVFKDYADEWDDTVLKGRKDRYIQEDNLWNTFVSKYNVFSVNGMAEEDKPYLRSIVFQYMYLALRQENSMKGSKHPKNNYPILPKTTINTQVAVSSWDNKNLWAGNNIFRRHIADSLELALREHKLFKRMNTFRKQVYDGILNNAEPGEIPDTYYLEEHSGLQTKKDQYAGVFEIRHGQDIEHVQSEWLNIWNEYIDEPVPYNCCFKIF
ncbi:DUF4157 domain-containing protein [Aquimarina sp. AD1]|uniref:eCIS core domain-containing protein n=1 Tax=Aquimarina sp. (strain AD1) TaxID=1714848 RepID=UPI0018F352A3|nr:DUF4157 domain-containing protein [Aquimarina sp. AD1]